MDSAPDTPVSRVRRMCVAPAETPRRGHDTPVFLPRHTVSGPDARVSRVRQHTGVAGARVCSSLDTLRFRRDARVFPRDTPVSRVRRMCVAPAGALRPWRDARVFLRDTLRFRRDAHVFPRDTPAFRGCAGRFSPDTPRFSVARVRYGRRTQVLTANPANTTASVTRPNAETNDQRQDKGSNVVILILDVRVASVLSVEMVRPISLVIRWMA